MKRITFFILGLLMMSGCEGASEKAVNPTAEAMNSILISASDYNLSVSSQPFFVITIENTSDQDFVNANFYLSIHNEGDEVSPNPFYLLPAEQRITVPSRETVTVNFEIPFGFLDENAIKKFEGMDRIIAFVQADGYIDSIDFYRSLNAEYLVLCHGPHPILKGAENISRELTNYRDAIQFIHDQTVQYMNRGLTPGEIKGLVKLPAHLAEDPYLQQTYGQVDRNIYEIFWWYRGYFTGRCRDLYTHSPQDEAEMAAELAGGVEELADKARQALDEEKAECALELADDVLILDPKNAGARETKNLSVIALAEETFNAQERNYLLSEHLLETGQVKITPGVFGAIDDHFVPFMPISDLLRIMAVRLNATKSLDKDMIVVLSLTDMKNSGEPSDYSLHIRNGILEALPKEAENAEFRVTTDSLVWKNLGLGKLDPKEAVEMGEVTITGGEPEAFYEFLGLFKSNCARPPRPKGRGMLRAARFGLDGIQKQSYHRFI